MQSLARTHNSQPIADKWLHEALFWAHFIIIACAVLMGLFLPWQLAASLIILHRLHFWVFDGCVLSRLQKKVGALSHTDEYLQQLTKRLFNFDLKQNNIKTADRAIVALSIMVIVTAQFFSFSDMAIVMTAVLMGMLGAVRFAVTAFGQRLVNSKTKPQRWAGVACKAFDTRGAS